MGLRIGIDATCWANNRGYGRYTRELVSALVSLAPEHEFVCFMDSLTVPRFDLIASNVRSEIVHQTVTPTVAMSRGGRSPLDMLRLTRAVRRAAVHAFFSPSVYGFFPLPPRTPAVITVHDAIPERFPASSFKTMRERLLWWGKMRFALAQAGLVLTVSDYAARELSAHLRVPASRIRVTLEGVSAEYRPSDSPGDIRGAAERIQLPPDARWVIYVGGFDAHKHVDVLVRAHAQVARRHPEQPLVLVLVGSIAGAYHQDVGSLQALVRELGTERLVRWTDYLPDAELRHLHSGAVALALVSGSEGFGLPAVEAARCGTPVVATTESPLPQVLEGGGVFVKPGDVGAIEQALEQLLTDEPARQAMGHRALERASRLSWSRSARVALDALHSVAGHRSAV